VRIALENTWALVLQASREEESWLDYYTSVEDTSWNARQSGEETRHRLYDTVLRRFPMGLVFGLRAAAKTAGVEVTFEDRRVKPCKPDLDSELTDWLRYYQREAVEAIARAGRGIIKVPTGGGKTEIFIGLTRAIPCEWLFIVNRIDLVRQTAERFRKRTGDTAGSFINGKWTRGTGNVTVSSFQTIQAGLRKPKTRGATYDFLQNFGAINIDEVHAQPADSCYMVTLACENAYYRVGQSGTPFDRSEVETLRTMGAVGPIVYEIPTQLLVQEGVLTPGKIQLVTHKHDVDPEDAFDTWYHTYNSRIVKNRDRNLKLVNMITKAAKPCLVFVDAIEHGNSLLKVIQQTGLRADFAYGQDFATVRDDKIKAIASGELDVLLCNVIFQEGIDIPELSSVVIAGGKKSIVAVLQRIGRGMRKHAGKTHFEVWDILDKGHRWLEKHAMLRRRAYESEGHEITLREAQ
jgi:superfamily II DNA or RNA helicase